jgi:hypothetical protein
MRVFQVVSACHPSVVPVVIISSQHPFHPAFGETAPLRTFCYRGRTALPLKRVLMS